MVQSLSENMDSTGTEGLSWRPWDFAAALQPASMLHCQAGFSQEDRLVGARFLVQ